MPDVEPNVEGVEFFGEQFQTPDRINQRLFLRFAWHSARGTDSESAEGMAVIDEMIDQCVRPEDSKRFDEVCKRERPDLAELMEFVSKVMAIVAERPTRRPVDSSAGPSTTPPSSELSAVDKGLTLVSGRPDLAAALLMGETA